MDFAQIENGQENISIKSGRKQPFASREGNLMCEVWDLFDNCEECPFYGVDDCGKAMEETDKEIFRLLGAS